MPLIPKPAHVDLHVYEIVEGDQIPLDLKNELLTLCLTCNAEDEVEVVFDNFARDRRFQGSLVNLQPNEKVGQLKNLRSAVEWIGRTIGVDQGEVERQFRLAAGKGSAAEQIEALEWIHREVRLHPAPILISADPSWLFRSNAGYDARAEILGANANCLPSRLGLPMFLGIDPYPSGIDFVAYAVDAERIQQCFEPTCLDGLYWTVKGVWMLGGRTRPIQNAPAPCVAMGGLQEVVALSPRFADIELQITLITN